MSILGKRHLREGGVCTTGDVARICRVAPRTASKWIDRGHLQGYRIPGCKDRRVRVEHLRAFMATHGMGVHSLDRELYTTVLVVNGTDAELAELADALTPADGWRLLAYGKDFGGGIAAAEANADLVVERFPGEDTAALVGRIRTGAGA